MDNQDNRSGAISKSFGVMLYFSMVGNLFDWGSEDTEWFSGNECLDPNAVWGPRFRRYAMGLL
jgi:hypothetical protein